MKWFKHDSAASLDAKLARVRLKYGMEGYGLYWFCLESIARNVETHNLSFELEEDAELLSTATNIHYERVQEMMTYMCNLGLFENCEGRITCLKMATRTDEYTQKLLRSTTIVPTMSRHTPDKVPPIRIDKNRIEENRVDKKESKAFKKPTLEQVATYVATRPIKINPQRFIDHYESNGWKVGRVPMKCWKSSVRTWEQKEHANTTNTVNGFKDSRRLSGAERTRLAREAAYERQRLSRSPDMGSVEPD